MNNAEYNDEMDIHYLDKEVGKYTESLESIFSSLLSKGFIKEFFINFKEYIFIAHIITKYDEEFLLNELYKLIVKYKDKHTYSFLYHHPSEILSKIKLES